MADIEPSGAAAAPTRSAFEASPLSLRARFRSTLSMAVGSMPEAVTALRAMLARRMAIAACAAAVCVGCAAFTISADRVEEGVAHLAVIHAIDASRAIRASAGKAQKDAALLTFLQDQAGQNPDAFAYAEIYTPDRHTLAKASLPGFDPAIATGHHPALPPPGSMTYLASVVGGKAYLHVITALPDGGWLEGVFFLSRQTFAEVAVDVLRISLLAAAAVVGFAVILYPLILSGCFPSSC